MFIYSILITLTLIDKHKPDQCLFPGTTQKHLIICVLFHLLIHVFVQSLSPTFLPSSCLDY